MITNQTYPVISIGYKFVKNAPYFILTAWPAAGFAERLEDRDSVSNSEKMTFLFTKKQINSLVSYFDEELIHNYIPTENVLEEIDEY